MIGVSPLYFSLFVLTNETNRYTAQLLLTPLRSHSCIKNWENTNNKEIKLFLAFIM